MKKYGERLKNNYTSMRGVGLGVGAWTEELGVPVRALLVKGRRTSIVIRSR